MSKRVTALFEGMVKTTYVVQELARSAKKIREELFGPLPESDKAGTACPPPLGMVGKIDEQLGSIVGNLREIDKEFSFILDELSKGEEQPTVTTTHVI